MWYPHTITVAAASEPVTLTEAKAQVRVDGSHDDALLTSIIEAARGYVEVWCGTPIISRTVSVKCDNFVDFAAFPIAPLTSVSSVSYVDSAGASQTLSTDVYEVRSDGLTASLALKYGQSWPSIRSGSRITVTAVVGYSTVPAPIKHSVLLLIGDWYRGRENTVTGSNQAMEMPHAVTSLLANYRTFAA